MTSLSSIVSNIHGAVADRPITAKASDELQSLFAKLHMDALGTAASGASPATAAATTASSATSTAATGGNDLVTGAVSGLRSIFDGAMTAASAARSAAKLAASYGSGVGMAGLAMQAFDKLA